MKARDLAWSLGILAAFVLVRATLLVVREPFYDELFTQWIARRSFAGILEALRHDSGPPLFYFVLKTLGLTTVQSARIFSLVCATLSAAMLLFARRLGFARFAATALLSVYAPSVLLSTDARAYALCGLFVTIGIVAVAYERDVVAAIAFALAAYSHYYGVLFFTALPRLRSIALSVALFIPGFLLAYAQPTGAMEWLRIGRESPLMSLPFAGRYPEALFAPAPWLLVGIAFLLLTASLSKHAMARFVLIPIGLVLLFELAGRPVYFPMRFESVLAVPLCLWLGSDPTQRQRVAVLAGQALIGAYVCVVGIVDHAKRPLDEYRVVALSARERVPATMPVVASGYLYLETVTALGDRVRAFPAEQAVHPGWRAFGEREEALPEHFLWIGERAAPELRLLCARRTCAERFGNAHAVAVEMQ